MTSRLQQITAAVAAKRAHDLSVATEAEIRRSRLAEAQFQGLRRWANEILPALHNSMDAVNDALRRGCEGSYLKEQSSHESLDVRGQVEHGRQKAVTLRLVLNWRPGTAITFALDAVELPDAVVLSIAADGKSVVSFVVDENFRANSVGVWLQRIVHEAATAAAV